jgi:hypothetical protein
MKMLLFGIFITGVVYSETQVYRGEAKAEGKKVYEEFHTAEFDKNKIISSVTEYKSPSGKILGILKNNYSKSLNAPEHTMEDPVHKNTHGLRYEGDHLILFNQDAGKKEETKKLDKDDLKGKLVVGGQGLHYYLVANLEEVIRKGELELKFLIPGRLDAYNFYLKVVKKSADNVEIDIAIDNWLLKLFAPKLKLIYDRKNPRLLKYSGLSNITDEKKDMMNVDIIYFYNN